jgi:hypothetical protein
MRAAKSLKMGPALQRLSKLFVRAQIREDFPEPSSNSMVFAFS